MNLRVNPISDSLPFTMWRERIETHEHEGDFKAW